jgi:hypothetical protein
LWPWQQVAFRPGLEQKAQEKPLTMPLTCGKRAAYWQTALKDSHAQA